MHSLNILDIAVTVVFFISIFLIAAYYSKNTGKSTETFFLSGRNLPWYVAGTAMIAPLIIYPIATEYLGLKSLMTLYPIVFGTTIIWLLVTFLTKPVSNEKLVKFYEKVHPGGVGWKPIAQKLPHIKGDSGFGRLFVDWLCGVVLVYASLFGVGKLILGEYSAGFLYFAIGLIAFFNYLSAFEKRAHF